jgi:hypothetical protein
MAAPRQRRPQRDFQVMGCRAMEAFRETKGFQGFPAIQGFPGILDFPGIQVIR